MSSFFPLLVSFIILTQAFPQTTPSTTQQNLPPVHQRIEVTATRLPESPDEVPAAIEVFTGDELRARGIRDVRSALSLAIGVEIAPGGDAGPASAVPALWGLKEFDAFLLVVDGVPWGGTFNPALTSLSLMDVERIEVLRGPAPVMYGATSFVGVIQVVHKDAWITGKELIIRGGSFESGGVTFSTAVPLPGNWTSRLTLDSEREGFSDERTAFRRGHGAWRVLHKGPDEKRFWFGVDLNWLDQDPASPRAREGGILSPLNPVDANYNPAGAFRNDHRVTVIGGFAQRATGGMWSTTASVSSSVQDALRGFLLDLTDTTNNAHGLREEIDLTDVYVDSHLSWKMPHAVSFLLGGDYLQGDGNARGADFDYTAPLNGAPAARVTPPNVLDVGIKNRRDFAGAYSAVEWSPLERLRIDAGIRLNITAEKRQGSVASTLWSIVRQTNVRPSGSVGAIWSAWQHNQDAVRLFMNYRDTFKPAAIDFGIGVNEGGERILKPETARSVEGGIKGRFFGGRLGAEASLFQMKFENLVISTNVNGLPALANAGRERFRGFETGTSLFLTSKVMARTTYSFHDAEFVDSIQLFDGVPMQLAGKRLEMSPQHLAALGVMYSPTHGVFGGIELNYTGTRFLNKRNTAVAEGFATMGVGAGYRTPRWELRVDGRNLMDRRDPVAESEIGDAQYYLMPPRRVDVSFAVRF